MHPRQGLIDCYSSPGMRINVCLRFTHNRIPSMEEYIVFLRGINVSGKNLIKMDDLRALLSGNGYQNVASYIQSGNLIFRSAPLPETQLENRISQLIHDNFGFSVPVFVLNLDELKRVVAANPFLTRENKPEDFLHLTILKNLSPPAQDNNETQLLEDGVEHAIITGNYIYLFLPDGYGNAKFNNVYFEKKFKVPATTRNWKTIKKMLSIRQ